MKIKALTNFTGALTMSIGQTLECNDKVILQDLLQCHYVEEVKETPNEKGVKKNESKRNSSK